MSTQPLLTGPLALLSEQLARWTEERATLLARVAEIDSLVANFLAAAGVDQDRIDRSLAPPVEERRDGRREGAMIHAALELIRASQNGLSRPELKAKLLEHSEHGPRIRRNENGFYNMIKRGLDREELVERNRRLYAADQSVPEATAPEVDVGAAANSRGPRPRSWKVGQLQPSGLPHMIYQVLDRYPEGLATPQIGDLVAALPGGAERLGVGRANLNPSLSKMYRAGHVRRFGKGCYNLPKYPEPTGAENAALKGVQMVFDRFGGTGPM